MANNIDPLKNFNFIVTRSTINSQFGLEANAQAGFTSISGLSRKMDVINYREGNDPRYFKKLAGLANYDPITLEQGIFKESSDLWAIANEIFASLQGGGQVGTISEEDAVLEDVTITLRQSVGGVLTPVKAWKCFDTWISEWNLANFDAATSDVLKVSAVLQMRFFEEVSPKSGIYDPALIGINGGV